MYQSKFQSFDPGLIPSILTCLLLCFIFACFYQVGKDTGRPEGFRQCMEMSKQ